MHMSKKLSAQSALYTLPLLELGAHMAEMASAIIAFILTGMAATIIAPIGAADAAEIKAFFPLSLEHTAMELIPPFERSWGHRVTIVYSTAGAVATKIRNGEAAD